jgi:hypothetical protein
VTVTTYSDDYAPSRQRHGIIAFLLELTGIAEPKLQLARSPIRRRPAEEYHQKFGDADVRERPQPEPTVTMLPLAIDPIADLKHKLRTLTYGEFMAATEGMGCDPKTAWKWATEESNVVPMRMAA